MITILYSQEKAIAQGFTGHPKTVLAAMEVNVYQIEENDVDRMEEDNFVDMVIGVDRLPTPMPDFIEDSSIRYDMDIDFVVKCLGKALEFAESVRHTGSFSVTTGQEPIGFNNDEQPIGGNRSMIIKIEERMTDEYWIDRHKEAKA